MLEIFNIFLYLIGTILHLTACYFFYKLHKRIKLYESLLNDYSNLLTAYQRSVINDRRRSSNEQEINYLRFFKN